MEAVKGFQAIEELHGQAEGPFLLPLPGFYAVRGGRS